MNIQSFFEIVILTEMIWTQFISYLKNLLKAEKEWYQFYRNSAAAEISCQHRAYLPLQAKK